MKLIPLLRRHPLLARVVLFLLLPLLLTAAWLWMDLLRSLPDRGSITLRQVDRPPVTLSRDHQGAILIEASADLDAYYAVGYAHAQDRLWQLQVQRWMVRGRLSEVFGKKSIDSDVWFRTLGLYNAAREAWPALSPEAQQSLSAYTRGINEAIAANPSLPPEFRLLGLKPEPWTEIDSLAWIKMFALTMGGNFRREIDHYLAMSMLSPQEVGPFFPSYPDSAPCTACASAPRKALEAVSARQTALQRDLLIAYPGTGSNAWAVQGRLTSTGGALLANDPHLGLQAPSLWYAISIRTPHLQVSGMSLVGLPVVVFGHNEHISWAGTNMMADTQDLFVERADVAGNRYATEQGWKSFDVSRELIRVRADFPERLRQPYLPVELKVRRSIHGPIISDYFNVFDSPVALRWTGLDQADTSYEAFYRLGYASGWAQFKQALQWQVAPAMNMLYADRQGNIGYLAAGRVPVRRQGQGTLPVPGWDGSHDWSGYIPSEQWVQAYNPPSGYIVSANNRIVGLDYPYFVSNDWASPARAKRIEQLLRERIDAGRKLTASDMQKIQGDTLDLDAAALMDVLRDQLPQQSHAGTAAAYLRDWHGDMRADSQAATVFNSWMRHFRQRLFQARLRGGWESPQASTLARRLGEGVGTAQLTELLQGDGQGWCDTRDSESARSCARLLAESQTDALTELHKLRGDWSMQSWGWSHVQQTRYSHIPFSGMKPFNLLFERRIGNGGSLDTINVAGSQFVDGEGYLQGFGAGFRQVMEIGPRGISHDYMISTGQSGNPLSTHFADMVKPFRDVRYYRLGFSTPAAEHARPSPAEGQGR